MTGKTCPVCGSSHDTWGGVATHMWKKSDDEHSHVESKDGGITWLARNGHMDPDDTPDDGDGVDDGGGSANPTFGDGDPSGSSSSDSPDEHDLPCGHESIPADPGDGQPVKVSCDTCGNAWRFEP